MNFTCTSSRRRLGQIATYLLFFAFTLTCLTKALQLVLTLPPDAPPDIHTLLRSWGLPARTSHLTSYPTAFTRDIHPKPIHSHNDYWRRIPLFSALAVGAISVEADVWEHAEELYVGHDPASLTRNRTLASLYVSPLARMLGDMNPERTLVEQQGGAAGAGGQQQPHGVWDADPAQTLHLYIDIKTPGPTTLPVVIAQLEALRRPRNFLTHWNGSAVVWGAVTVHLTGDTPFELMVASSSSSGEGDYRDYFYDAPLAELAGGRYNVSNSLMATANFKEEVGHVYWGGGGMREEMREVVRAQVKEAHERGIGVRYWDTPSWPLSVRNDVWGELVRLGVDLLNADDIKAAAERAW